VVNKRDITAIRNEWKHKHGAQPTIFGEILGDGTVNASDYRAARKFLGVRLPKLSDASGTPSAALVHALAREEGVRENGARPTSSSEILADGTVNVSDDHVAIKLNGTRLQKSPKPAGNPPQVIRLRTLARQQHDATPRHPA
jgi:hypothetical protein